MFFAPSSMSVPHELSGADRLALVRAFVREQFTSRGMVADIAIHEPVPEKGAIGNSWSGCLR